MPKGPCVVEGGGLALWLCFLPLHALAQSQVELPDPEREPAAQPAPPAPEPAPSPAPPAQPAAPAPAPPAAAPAAPAPQPVPAGRFEGQVSPEDDVAAEDYEPEHGSPEEDYDHGGGFRLPPISVRIDPFNWLIEGRLGVELEVALTDLISIELVPVFVVNTRPPLFDLSGREAAISQHSNGLGPIAGTSVGVGFWFAGRPFSGYVARLIFTNYGYNYRSSLSGRTFDSVDFTERRLMAFIGSYSRIGFFTIGGGVGLAYELNQQQRCFPAGSGQLVASHNCPDEDVQQILLEPARSNGRPVVTDINGDLHPFYLEARFSLGLAF